MTYGFQQRFQHAKFMSGTILLIVDRFRSVGFNVKVNVNLKRTGGSCSESVIE